MTVPLTVVALDPPNTFAWTWNLDERETVVRFDLKPDGDGCWLTLTHSGLSPKAGRGSGQLLSLPAPAGAPLDGRAGRRA